MSSCGRIPFVRARLAAALFALSSTAGAPPAAATPNEAAREIAQALVSLRLSGFDELDHASATHLALGASITYRVRLQEGLIYAVVVGGCADAWDVDLTIHDPRGALIAGDNEKSRRASAVLLTERSGEYRVTITMWEAPAAGAQIATLVAH